MEYSRLSKTTGFKQDIDLNQLLAEILIDLEVVIEQKKASIENDHLPVIKAIPIQINQLFSNLITNSLKYTSKDPIITIACSLVSDQTDKNCLDKLPPGKNWQFIFTDNGIGFEPQYSELIFSLFQRLHGKHEYTGTGIGLSLFKKIMENHGGYICAEGALGKGAKFYVYFPAES